MLSTDGLWRFAWFSVWKLGCWICGDYSIGRGWRRRYLDWRSWFVEFLGFRLRVDFL